MINTMLLRRFYKGAAFDSTLLKIFSPFINFADLVAQYVNRTNKESPLPPFVLRARSSGVLNQFGGKRFTTQSREFTNLLLESEYVPEGEFKYVEVGCGVGRLLRAMELKRDNFRYVGIDIDPASIDYCNSRFDKDKHEFHLIDVSNGTYRPDGSKDPKTVVFDVVQSNSADLVVAWSVFTHMEIDHIRHYLVEIARMLKSSDKSYAVLSAFVYDSRDWIQSNFIYEHNEGFTVNRDNPMKAIAYSREVYEQAFADAGLELTEPFIAKKDGQASSSSKKSQGQDLFIAQLKRDI